MEDLIIGLIFLVISILLIRCVGGGGCTVKPEPSEESKKAHAKWLKKNPPKGQGIK
jgi:hypothetical protein